MDMDRELALLYVRVSTNKQAKMGHSMRSQPAILTEAAERDGYRVEVITETSSGRKSTRPELMKVLARLAKGEAKALYALDIDRLARSTMHLLEISQLSAKEKWRLVITTTNVDTSTPEGAAFLTMAAAFAEMESGLISRRVTRQHQARRDRGEIWGVTHGNRSKLPIDTRKTIEAMRAQGLALRKIADQLNADGVPTVRGGAWYGPGIAQILNSPMSNRDELDSNRNS
jgi:DNA invertase Pin-like site-specific DNA recombinase